MSFPNYKTKIQASREHNRGFTLLEMLVSLGIFAVVAVMAVGALVRITGLNRQAQTLQSSMNNLGYALESMSRELRVSMQYNCSPTTADWNNTGGTVLTKDKCDIVTTPTKDRIIAYESAEHHINSGAESAGECQLIYAFGFFTIGTNKWSLRKAQQTFCGQSLTNKDKDYSPIIDETNTTITDYRLGVYAGAGGYSRVFIRLMGTSGTREKERNDFDIQTSVSGRISEI